MNVKRLEILEHGLRARFELKRRVLEKTGDLMFCFDVHVRLVCRPERVTEHSIARQVLNETGFQ